MTKKKSVKKATKKTESTQEAATANFGQTMPDKDSVLVPCMFKPQPDITAFELAILLHYLLQRKITLGDWERLDETVPNSTRHLTIIKQQKEEAAPKDA